MPRSAKHATAFLSTFSAPGGTAVVVGGTTGIGRAVSIELAARGVTRVLVAGRSAPRGAAVCDALRAAAPGVHAEFLACDVMTVKGMRAAADTILAATGPAGIDYLFMTQNGVPSGVIRETEDGIEQGFAVQAVSRFALAHLLTTRGALRPGAKVVSVANTGRDLPALSLDDLSLRTRAKGRWAAGLFFDQSFRDSCVLDAAHLELQARHPEYAYYHLHPGIVKSEGMVDFKLSDAPFPVNLMFWSAKFAATEPAAYAKLPVYVALCPDTERAATLGADRFLDWKLQTVVPGAWARDAQHRTELWAKLLEMIGEAS